MLRIIGYDNGVVNFFCGDCKTEGEYKINNVISDNCALDIDVQCHKCAHKKTLYFLRCTDQALAKDLSASLEVLKIRKREEQANGNQVNGEISN